MRAVKLRRNQRGFVAVEFVFGLAVLLLPMALLVMSFPTWAEHQSMARTAAREAARAYAVSGDADAARSLVADMVANYGYDASTVDLQLSDYPTGALGPEAAVSAEVSVRIPALKAGGFDIVGESFTYTARHSEPLDLYRSRATS